MTDDTPQAERINGTVTVVGDTYIVAIKARYVTALGREGDSLQIGANMSEEEARALLAGLQEALAP